jgi:predicted RNA-binding Zn-ribbon protein involved in translation (DUF1610 family)
MMFCPNCGKQTVVASDTSPNGGGLYVAEEMEGCTEFYDDAVPYQCQLCLTNFYIGGEELSKHFGVEE